jgi:hypothetical protein
MNKRGMIDDEVIEKAHVVVRMVVYQTSFLCSPRRLASRLD